MEAGYGYGWSLEATGDWVSCREVESRCRKQVESMMIAIIMMAMKTCFVL